MFVFYAIEMITCTSVTEQQLDAKEGPTAAATSGIDLEYETDGMA